MGRFVGRARCGAAMVELTQLTRALQSWIVEAYDVWWRHGADHVRGGFHERLNHDLTSPGEPRRSRLHPRQAFAYSHAPLLRWAGPSARAVEHALGFFMAHYRREDGLFRALVSPQGDPLNDEIVLYDQAFALLGLASGYAALNEERWRESAIELHDAVRARLAHTDVGFAERFAQAEPLSANSHMHLLEATLAWSELDEDPRWRKLAEELVELALTRLIDPHTGALPEFFTANWRRQPDWVVEPGHQFEWAWLLLRFLASRTDAQIERAALRLIEIGETHGVHRKRRAAIASLGTDFSVRDPHARLWSQCERIKAACSAHALTGAAQYEAMALEATETLANYLDTPIRGLWRDRLDAWGSFIEEPAPASSLYHLVGAVLELSRLVERLWPLNAESTQDVTSASAGAAPRDLPGGFPDR
jgi:mannose/cellobiose epimerase-like protein (N-acyl-D-glucosamine 2-epimerase family)